jgi:hypothetical protein
MVRLGEIWEGAKSRATELQWLPGNMSRPHFHPNDRFFIVVSGT